MEKVGPTANDDKIAYLIVSQRNGWNIIYNYRQELYIEFKDVRPEKYRNFNI